MKCFLDSKSFFTPYQSGFREYRSTYDHLIKLEADICDAFLKNLHLVTIALDLEKAFEMIWRDRVLKILQSSSVNGNMLSFIKNFLYERLIQVKVNDTFSKQVVQKNGVPQGSVLSVTLFLVAINDIVTSIDSPVKCCLFADDLTIYATGKNHKVTEELLQTSLNKLLNWTSTSGFKFSTEKTKYTIFSNSKQIPEIHLTMHNIPIERTDEIKILGLIFDRKLSWKNHLNYLKTTTTQRLNILKTLSARNWGADHQTLLNTYKALILSKLDYASIIYGGAKTVSSLNAIHNKAIKIALGAYHTSPTLSILAESKMTPLEYRRIILMGKYACKIASIPCSPTFQIIFNNESVSYLDFNKCPEPFSFRLQNALIRLSNS